MGANTKIEWADDTFNGWWGCTEISDACDHCYARELAARFGKDLWGDKDRELKSGANWAQPLKWQRDADRFEAEYGRKRFVFTASMSDVFDNQVDPAWRARLWDLIRQCDRLIWLVLTKRPQNIRKMLPPDWGTGWQHVWLGTTVEHQEAANRNISALMLVPAFKRFLSCEPLLGPINLTDWQTEPEGYWGALEFIDWVIAGGESGPKARPSHPDWIRSLCDQCKAADVPFLFKQWGSWLPVYDRDREDPDWKKVQHYSSHPFRWLNLEGGQGFHGERVVALLRSSKTRAGRELDGVTHDGRPDA
jgi:protein gp37